MRLENKKVIALVSEDFEDLELWYPVMRLREEGAEVHLVGEKAKETYKGKYGVPAVSDYAFSDVKASDYDAILVPGGWAPDKLRRYPEVIEMVQYMDEHKKPIGQICHAGWVLISAKILNGTVTSQVHLVLKMTWRMLALSGMTKPLWLMTHIISSRRPPDLPPYAKAFADVLAEQ
ncbi:type 1 glutamine amidotransferase [Priestia flexa]|nr:type 1 glutamine amidotransferase [Priestia flexa]